MDDGSVDYQAYLAGLYPGTTWSLARLAGGLVNRTLRATLVAGSAPHRSLIVKHARPYVETAGPEWAFSTDRQAIEAAVLSLWHTPGTLARYRQQPGTAWHTPRLIRHDQGPESALRLTESAQESSVLLLSDFGPLVNIVEFLASAPPTGPSATDVDAIAATVGRAFALLHSPRLAAAVRAQPDVEALLTHHLGRDVVRRACIEPLLARLAVSRDDEDARTLYGRVVADFEGPEDYAYRECFTLGDFTPGSILMRQRRAAADGELSLSSSSSVDAAVVDDSTPILVDWEFAQVNGRGVNGDMAQFLASMRCEILASKKAGGGDGDSDSITAAAHDNLVRFTTGFCAAYRNESRLQCRRLAVDPNAQLLRSALIMHGREVVNQAHDVHAANPSFADMVASGAACIEIAGDDMAAFVDGANWARLAESEAAELVTSLFNMEWE